MKQFRKPSYHIFLTTQLPRYQWHHNLMWSQKLFFQICLNYISLGCSFCTEQFLIKHYGFKTQGKRDITSDAKRYYVITGRQGKFFSEDSHIIYHSKGLSLYYIMSRTCLRVNPHSIVVWMSRNSLLETGAISEVYVAATEFEHTTT